MDKPTTEQQPFKTGRELRWFIMSWVDSILLVMIILTLDMPLVAYTILGVLALFFFAVGTATLLTRNIKGCQTGDATSDDDLKMHPTCHTDSTNLPVSTHPGNENTHSPQPTEAAFPEQETDTRSTPPPSDSPGN